MKLLNNHNANREGSEKFAHTTIHHSFTVTFGDTPGYSFVQFKVYLSLLLSFLCTTPILAHNSK